MEGPATTVFSGNFILNLPPFFGDIFPIRAGCNFAEYYPDCRRTVIIKPYCHNFHRYCCPIHPKKSLCCDGQTGMPGSASNFSRRFQEPFLNPGVSNRKLVCPLVQKVKQHPEFLQLFYLYTQFFLSLCIAIASKDCSRNRWYDCSLSRSFFSVFFFL